MVGREDLAGSTASPISGRESDITGTLADYIASTAGRSLPDDVRKKTVRHIVDTVAAIVSGSALPPGAHGQSYVAALGGTAQSSVIGTSLVSNPLNAALANGMFAHADETDDSHAPSLTHPGCAIIPAALAIAERQSSRGADLVSAIALGYDIGPRISMALGGSRFADRYHHSSHAFGGIFGATAAASALLGLNGEKTAHALSHAVQMASGNRCWIRDPDHIQKAFIFGGMPAQGGVQAALLAAHGVTGAPQALEGVPGLFAGFFEEADARKAIAELGERFEIMRTSIKRWSVGSPCQAALDGIEELTRLHGFGPQDIVRIRVTLPAQRAQVVDSAMPNINVAHLIALYLADGGASFASVHDEARMRDPHVLEIRKRIVVEPRPGAERGDQAQLFIELADGRMLVREPRPVRGQPGNPMDDAEIVAKAEDLVFPVLGERHGVALIRALMTLDGEESVSGLAPLWRPEAGSPRDRG